MHNRDSTSIQRRRLGSLFMRLPFSYQSSDEIAAHVIGGHDGVPVLVL
jgi:hypothetical protein